METSSWVAICKRDPGKQYTSAYHLVTHNPFSDGSTYSSDTESILHRTRELSSEIRENEPEVLAAFSGLRPSREGGPRVERSELTAADGSRRPVVHNYGAGGTGFQAGYGMATDVVDTVQDVLTELSWSGHGKRLSTSVLIESIFLEWYFIDSRY